MTSSAVTTSLRAGVELVRRGLDLVLSGTFGTTGDDELLSVLRDLEVQRRRMAAADSQLLGEVDARGLAQQRGARDTAALVRLMLRVDPGEGRARVAAARNLALRSTLSGERLEPALPRVAQALRDGAISAAHASVIATTLQRLPLEVQATKHGDVEAQLVAEARRFTPAQLAVIGRRVNYLYDQDGALANDRDRARRRALNYRRHADGTVTGSFELDAITGEAFETVLDALLRQVSAEQRGDRSPAQLRHDALRDLLLMSVRTGQLPTSGGVTTTIIVTVTLAQWAVLRTLSVAGQRQAGVGSHDGNDGERTRRPPGGNMSNPQPAGLSPPGIPKPPGQPLAMTQHGALVSLGDLAPLVGDAQVLPVALAELGTLRRVDAYGTKHRIFSENQRLALSARDRGCTFPGCTSAPAWCEAHHVRDHAAGGPTSVDNAALLCPYHHRSFDELGYRCVMIDGMPHWIAPAWIDPVGTPQRNTAHDPAHAPLPETP